MKKKLHKKHFSELKKIVKHQEDSYDPGYYAVGRDPVLQSRTRFAGNAFLVMGVILVSLPFAFFFLQLNHSVADWIGSIFFHFIPGVILLISAFKVLMVPDH